MAIVTKDKASRKARDMFEKGFSAMDRGNLDYAIDMFLHVLEVEPGFFEARKFLRAAEMKRFRESGGGQMTHLLSTLTGLPGLLGARAKLSKKPLDALHDAERLLQKDPLNPTFVYLLCDAAEALNMPEVAVQTLEILRDNNPDNNALQHRLADAYRKNNQMSEAREIYSRLLQMKPNDQTLLKQYKDASALATMQAGGWDQAGSFRDKMRDAKEAITLEQEGKAVKTASDVESLIEDTLRKIEGEPENINYKRALADLYTKAGRFDEAYDVLAEASAGAGDPQLDRTMSNIRVQQFEAQIKALQEAGNEAGVEAKRAVLRDFLLEDVRSRAQRYPNDRDLRHELGMLLFERGEYDEALQQFQVAERSPKRRISAMYHIGLCFKHKKLYDMAWQQLETAAREIPVMDAMKKDALYELGLLAEQVGKPEEATRFFKEIYSVDVGYRDVAQKIEQSYGAD
jgi:tetratricopeptide (TPR) repeat protein